MFSAGLNEIALALAVGGIGVGLLGVHRRSVHSLALIGASLGFGGAGWLAVQAFRHGGPLTIVSPPWMGGGRPILIPFSSACFLAFQSMISFFVCRLELHSADGSASFNRVWVLAPIAVSSLVLFNDPLVFAAAFLTSNAVVVSVADRGRSLGGVVRLVGALAFVVSVVVASAKTPAPAIGSPDWSIDVSTRWSVFLLAASIVIPLISILNGRGGLAERATGIVAPNLILAALALQITVAPFGGRLSAMILLTVASISAWTAWRAFWTSDSTSRLQRIAAMLLAFGVVHWLNMSSTTSMLAYIAAASCVNLAFVMIGAEGDSSHFRGRPLAVGVGVAIVAAIGGVLANTVERATEASLSITGAANWLSIGLLFFSLALATAALKSAFRDLRNQGDRDNADQVVSSTILVLLAMLAGMMVVASAMLPNLASADSGLAELFRSNRSATRSPDLFTVVAGIAMAISAVGVGLALPDRGIAKAPNLARENFVVQVTTKPFLVLESIIEVFLVSAFSLFPPRQETTPRRAPVPAVIVVVAAVAGAAALLSIHHRGGFSP